MLIDIEESRCSFAENVYNKMVSKKYGIRTPYCENDIIQNKLIGDLLYIIEDADVTNINNIDINNIFVGITINYITNNYDGSPHYRHVQSIASAVWDVVHGLGANPVVAVYDDAGQQIDAGVEINVQNTSVKIYLNTASTGVAECSI